MGQPIYCDIHAQGHLADVMVSRLTDGETMAACDAGYVELCRVVVDQANVAQAEAEAAQAEADAAQARADDAEADATAADVADRLTSVGGDDVAFPATDQVVRRGRSRSRAAYEARRRATEAGPAQDTAPPDSGPPGAVLAAVGDEAPTAD